MLRWCSRHPIWFMAGYLMLYLAVFRWQELHLTPVVWVHTPLDDLIPFCEYAILPYLAWFVWIPFTLFALLRGPRTDFMRLCLPLFAGMTAALTCYMLLAAPAHGTRRRTLRPAGALAVHHRHPHQRMSFHPCIQLCDSGAGLPPQPDLCRGKPAVAPGCILRSVHRYLRLHHAAQAAQLH